MKWKDFKELVEQKANDETEICFILMDVGFDPNKLSVFITREGSLIVEG
jgi:hypothetical protein